MTYILPSGISQFHIIFSLAFYKCSFFQVCFILYNVGKLNLLWKELRVSKHNFWFVYLLTRAPELQNPASPRSFHSCYYRLTLLSNPAFWYTGSTSSTTEKKLAKFKLISDQEYLPTFFFFPFLYTTITGFYFIWTVLLIHFGHLTHFLPQNLPMNTWILRMHKILPIKSTKISSSQHF